MEEKLRALQIQGQEDEYKRYYATLQKREQSKAELTGHLQNCKLKLVEMDRLLREAIVREQTHAHELKVQTQKNNELSLALEGLRKEHQSTKIEAQGEQVHREAEMEMLKREYLQARVAFEQSERNKQREIDSLAKQVSKD